MNSRASALRLDEVTSRPRPLKRNHREQLFRFQTHATTHVVEDCSSETCSGIPEVAEWSHLQCPLCLDMFPLDQLDEDHAPQNAGQSRLGSRHLTVLVCRDCNQTCGKSFEKTAAYYRNALTAPKSPFCEVHHRNRRWATTSGLEIPVDYSQFDLTDVKAAYLLAFVTLGYSWALTGRLDEVRSALIESRVSGDYAIGDKQPNLPSFAVLEVSTPIPCVVVTSDTRRIYLPCEATPSALASALRVVDEGIFDDRLGRPATYNFRSFEWPRSTIGAGAHPEKTWDHSYFFALDRCGSDDHGHSAEASRETLRQRSPSSMFRLLP